MSPLSFPLLNPISHSENGGLHDDHVCSLHVGQVSLPVLRFASHDRGPNRPHPPAATTADAGEDPRPGPHPAGAASGRPQGAASESLCPGIKTQ